MSRAALHLIVAAAALVGATAAHAQDLTIPPWQGVYEPQGVDERGMWMQADETERAVRDSNLLIRDAALNDYVRSVLCSTVGNERCRNIRLYILRIPAFNAETYPNGMMTVWSGLLLRCRNEAELASVLAHEFAHFERRHALMGYRRTRTAGDIIAWTALLGAITSQPTNVGFLVLGGLFQFDRNQEREADILGLAYLRGSIYRPQVAAEIWTRMMNEADATALGRAQRSRRYDRTPFFATHPTELERATYLSNLAGPQIPDRTENADAYAAAMRPWIRGFLEDQIRRNDFGGSEYVLSQLAERSGWTADLLFARAELYRMRGNPRDLINAADFYRESISLDDGRAEAYRGLGLALMRARVNDQGKAALVRYLEMRPDASDASMIRTLVDQAT